jgi:hypothetical protein
MGVQPQIAVIFITALGLGKGYSQTKDLELGSIRHIHE